ncbi:MAG: peptidylprolyl isomerase [Erysipelotrichaceae bacterium]|nr:peptidylprolyl isomerase [Erysipelotrichaceae bacterium]
MGKFFKKNWFVILVVILFAGISIYYIYDTNKGKLKGKSSSGKDVVYEVDGEDKTADDFYDELYKSNGTTSVVSLFKQAVADQSVSTTSAMKDTAKTQAASIRSSYSTNYGTSADTQLASDLKSTGYTDLEEYLIEAQKILKVTGEYAKANFDDLQIHQVSYILIKFTDSSNVTDTPTEDEASRMKTVDDALSSGTDFASVATSHSEDTSTATSGGDLGVIDKNTSSVDSTFLSATLALKEGETSGWVKSSSFGYFKIYCTASTPDTLAANNTSSDPYVSLVQKYDTTLENKAIWDKAQSLGIDFHGNDDLELTIKTSLAITDDDSSSSDAEASASASAEATASASASAEATAGSSN